MSPGWTKPKFSMLVLHGDVHPPANFPIYPASLRKVFLQTYGQILVVLKQEIRRVISLGRDFAIVLCGGSYYSKGLRHMVQVVLLRLQGNSTEKGVSFKWRFLAEHDPHW